MLGPVLSDSLTPDFHPALDVAFDEVTERVFNALEQQRLLEAMPPAAHCASVFSALGSVATVAAQIERERMPNAPGVEAMVGPGAWAEALFELAVTSLAATNAHSLHPIPGRPTTRQASISLVYWNAREQACQPGWDRGEPADWFFRLSVLAGNYAHGLQAALHSRGGPRLEASGPAASEIAAAAMLAAAVSWVE